MNSTRTHQGTARGVVRPPARRPRGDPPPHPPPPGGRTTHAQLAKETGLSAPAIGERIRKLEAAGVIRGFQAVLDPEKVGLAICAVVAISPPPRKPAQELVDRLLSLPEAGGL